MSIFLLFLIKQEKLSFFHQSVWCFCGLYIDGFYFVEVGYLYSQLFKCFCHERLSFIKWIFCTNSDTHVGFFFFILLLWCINTDFWILNYPCIPGINQSGCVILLSCKFGLLVFCWGFLLQWLEEVMAYSFLVVALSSCTIQAMLAS